MVKELKIKGRKIGPNYPPYLIAEMSANHNGSIDRALETMRVASECGADAIKIQTYTADTMTIDSDNEEFLIKGGLWDGFKLYDLYKWAETPYEWHEKLFKYAESLGLTIFSSPFDETAVDFLENLNAPAYKIASFENNHLPLIHKAAATGKPIIISTGMANLSELELAVKTARDAGCTQLILLKCTSTYPATPENTNIRTIPHLRDLFNAQVGLSDHTMGLGVAVASVALGATVIEKHFTLARSDGGVDSAFSMEPQELAVSCLDAPADGPDGLRMPCGACRQVIQELMPAQATVHIDGVGSRHLAELLPDAFSLVPEDNRQ